MLKAGPTGKPAVVMGQGLFIGSNASFGIMEAMLSSSPHAGPHRYL